MVIMIYHLARDNQQFGTFSESEINSKYSSGDVFGTDLCWKKGMVDWQPVSAVFIPNVVSAPAINPYAAPRADVSRQSSKAAPLQQASRSVRLGAQILDVLVILIVAAILGVVAAIVTPGTSATGGMPGDSKSSLSLVFIVAGLLFLPLVVYNLYLLSTQGQTLGKKWLGIRIVRYDDNGQAGFVKACLLRVFVNGLFGAIPGLGPIYSLIDILFIFSDDNRCLHDKLSGTHVVKD